MMAPVEGDTGAAKEQGWHAARCSTDARIPIKETGREIHINHYFEANYTNVSGRVVKVSSAC